MIMNKIITFISGIMIGIYLEQTYKMPSIKTYMDYVKILEKNNRKE